jgi:hypothetical protein
MALRRGAVWALVGIVPMVLAAGEAARSGFRRGLARAGPRGVAAARALTRCATARAT